MHAEEPDHPDDNPEWSERAIAEAKRASEVHHPDIAAQLVRPAGGRPPLPAGARKEAVSLRLSRRVLEHFRATGPGWQTRINDVLEQAVDRAGKGR